MTEPLFEVTMTVTVRDPDPLATWSEPQDHIEVTVRGHDLDETLVSATRSATQLARQLTSRTGGAA